MPSKPRHQRRSERLLADAAATHGYLDRAIGSRNDLIAALNLERAFKSFGMISRRIAREQLDPSLEDQLLAAQQGLEERLYNVAYAVVEP